MDKTDPKAVGAHYTAELVKEFGGQAAFARAIGAPPTLVYQWATKRRPISPRFAIAIEQATGGSRTRYDLRADVFGEAPALKRRAGQGARS